jgi:hypothetical protein
MSFIFSKKTVYDPRIALRNAEESDPSAPLPITSWVGKPNHYHCPLGCKPGTGYLLMLHKDLNDLDLGDAHTMHLHQSLVLGGKDKSVEFDVQKMVVLGPAECLSPGQRDDDLNLKLVSIADRRHTLWNGKKFSAKYNQRSNTTGEYLAPTLKGGNPWTWEQLFLDLWPKEAGDPPTLPFHPHGIPDGLCYGEVSKFQAVQHFLTRIGCDLKYDPHLDEFTVKRLGDKTSNGTKWDPLQSQIELRRLFDYNPARGAFLPEVIRVRFRIVPCPDDGAVSFTVIEIHNDPLDDDVMPGVIVTLNDDAYALLLGFGEGGSFPNSGDNTGGSGSGSGSGGSCAGESFTFAFPDAASYQNSGYLIDRAFERACDYMRIRRNFALGEAAIYSGLFIFGQSLTDQSPFAPLGEFIADISFEDRAATEDVEPGIRTGFGTGSLSDRRWEEWKWDLGDGCCRCVSNPGGSGSGSSSGGGRVRAKFITCVRLVSTGSGSDGVSGSLGGIGG